MEKENNYFYLLPTFLGTLNKTVARRYECPKCKIVLLNFVCGIIDFLISWVWKLFLLSKASSSIYSQFTFTCLHFFLSFECTCYLGMEIPWPTACGHIRNEKGSQVLFLCEERGHDFSCEHKFQIECNNKAEEYYFNSTNNSLCPSTTVFPRGQIFSENDFASLKWEETGCSLLHWGMDFAEVPKASKALSRTLSRDLWLSHSQWILQGLWTSPRSSETSLHHTLWDLVQ